MEGLTSLRLPTLQPDHLLICATHDITVIVKKIVQNPAMLPTQLFFKPGERWHAAGIHLVS